MNDIERLIYNQGERLIPGISHNEAETIRHSASYKFFSKLIIEDLQNYTGPLIILDLGCGVGHGCKTLSEIPKAMVFGIDNSFDVIEYAKEHYSGTYINYKVEDLTVFIPKMPVYPYVVSRGVIEHIEKGIELLKKINFSRMLIFDVPYNEKPGNKHHLLTGIIEDNFKSFNNIEFYYESIDGVITKEKDNKTNMLMCVCRR